MAQKDRIAIFPSRANNVLIKNRLLSARKGHSMLKRKRDALDMKMRELIAQRKATAANCSELYKNAIFLIAKANFLDTDLKPAPIIGSQRADAYMRLSSVKMIGLTLATFEPVLRKPEALALTGLSRGGAQVDEIRAAFQELFRLLVLISSFDYSIKVLKDALHTTNMRLNGLEFVIMPRLSNTTAYILNELDEMEREEFYRLKRSQKNRKKKISQDKKEGGDEDENEYEDEDGIHFVDVWTITEESMFEERTKPTQSQMAQTIISGHLPTLDEIISPTDSLISGIQPVVGKRTNYELWIKAPKEVNSKEISTTTDPRSSSTANESAPAPSTPNESDPASSTAKKSSSNASVEENE